MEPLFAVRMTHDEDMYYNQVLASKQSAPAEKPGKKNFLSRVDLSDVIFGLLAFFVFYMTFPAEELAQRLCGRGTEAEHVRRARLDKALEELGHAGEFHYRVVNDDAQRAAEEIHAIVTSVKSAPHSAAVKE